MKQPFAYRAELSMPDGVDLALPGAAITLALCGSWDHQPPCPLAPHHTAAARAGDRVEVRTLFAAEPADVAEVERRIAEALSGPGRWRVLAGGPSDIRPDEGEHAARLARS